MRFREKDFEIPQVCLDLGFEDTSYNKERSARMYHRGLNLTLWVTGPSAGLGAGKCSQDSLPATRVVGKNRYVLQDCGDGILGEVETDDELRKLVDSVRGRVYARMSGPGWQPIPEPSEEEKKRLVRISENPETYQNFLGVLLMRDPEGRWFMDPEPGGVEGMPFWGT